MFDLFASPTFGKCFLTPERPDQRKGCLSGSSRKRRLKAGHRPHGLEHLEQRCLMAANLISIVGVQPASGELLTQSPQKLVITFNQPATTFDQPNFAAFDSTGTDFQLEEVNRDGTRTPVFDLVNNPPPETYTETTTQTGTVTEFTIPLQSALGLDPPYTPPYDLTLQPGTYEIELVGGTGLSADASGSDPGLWDASQPHVIGRFTVLGAGASFAGATPLGTIGQAVQTTMGSLNPDDFHSAVQIYRFDLAQGHLWQVGVSVSANSIGSALLPAVTLFDSGGNVLVSRNSGTGLPSNPNDPYIITGLSSGTYFVGISGAGNLPYGSSGYDPVMGIPGRGGINQPGGPFGFQLDLTAQPHDRPTGLVNFNLDRADPTDTSPTGLTLTFNGPLDLSKLFVPGAQQTALQVIDSSGQLWPITPQGYEVRNARLTLVFNQPLPAGHYWLVMPPQGGLTDLAGVPVTALGEPSGILADWIVAPSAHLSTPADLGVLWPATADGTNPELAAKFSQTTNLTAGQTATYRWVVTVPGFYKLQTQVGSGTVSILNFADGQPTVLEAGTNHQLNDYLMYLNAGIYRLRFINVGSQPVVVAWTLKSERLDWEKIVDNGVSQQSALSLMLFSPPDSNQNPGGDVVASFQAISGAPTLNSSGGPSGPLSPSLFVTLNTSLIGLATPSAHNVAPVGPTVETGAVALADSSTGLHPGIGYGSLPPSSAELGNTEPSDDAQPTASETLASEHKVDMPSGDAIARLDAEAKSARADQNALDQAEWWVHLGSRLSSWLIGSPVATNIEGRSAMPVEQSTMAGRDAVASQHNSDRFNPSRRSISAAQVDIGAAASLIIVGTVAFRLRQPLQKWWRQGVRRVPGGSPAPRPFGQGPHALATRTRGTARARRTHAVR
jgi:hypothetical protein